MGADGSYGYFSDAAIDVVLSLASDGITREEDGGFLIVSPKANSQELPCALY